MAGPPHRLELPPLLPLLLPPLAGSGCRTPPARIDPAEPAGAAPVGARLILVDFDTLEAREASGFFVHAGGMTPLGPRPFPVLVTGAHALAGSPVGVWLSDGREAVVIETLASDPHSDVALLRMSPLDVEPLPLAPAGAAPDGELRAVTKDGVTAAWYVGPHDDPETGEAILFRAPGLGPGASGGALLDRSGRVVGVTLGCQGGVGPRCRRRAICGFHRGGKEGGLRSRRRGRRIAGWPSMTGLLGRTLPTPPGPRRVAR